MKDGGRILENVFLAIPRLEELARCSAQSVACQRLPAALGLPTGRDIAFATALQGVFPSMMDVPGAWALLPVKLCATDGWSENCPKVTYCLLVSVL